MPLIVVCGIPGSGKTKRANEVAEYLREKHGKHVVVVNEENLGINKQLAYSSTGFVYSDAHEEKIARGRIKFEVEKNLVGTSIVIVDSLNYIKGYRYQMHCVAREQKTTYCLIYCNTPLEIAQEFNKKNENRFTEEMVEDYCKRMEPPQLKSN